MKVFPFASRFRPVCWTPMSSSESRSSTRSAGIVSIAVMSSRVLGLIREQVFAYYFGAGKSMDAFITAFRIPNMLRDLFAEGALSTAFVTVFSKKIATEGEGAAWALANKVATLATIFMSAVTLLGVLTAPQLVAAIAPGFDPHKTDLTVQLTRIMYPFILLVSLAALVMGMLNAKKVFGIPAMASSFFNLGSIVGGIGFGYWMDPHFGERSLIGLAIGTLIGGFLQLIVQFPSLRRVGYRYKPDFAWRDSGVGQVIHLMIPAVIAGSAVQVNVAVNSIFASYLGDGAVSWLGYAFRLMQLPLGVFGVAVATVTLPIVSAKAALGDSGEFRAVLARALRLVFFLTIPSALGLMVLGEPIVRLIFERNRFDAADTEATALALQYYAFGLVGYSGVKVLAPAFYAIDKRFTPMLISFVSIGLNLGLNWLFTFRLGWGHKGLAFSTALIALINFSALYFLMRKHTKRFETKALFLALVKVTIAALLMACVCLVGDRWVLAYAKDSKMLLYEIFALLGTIGVAGAVYLGATMALRVDVVEDFTRLAMRKLGRRRN